MALNNYKCNHLVPLHFKGLILSVSHSVAFGLQLRHCVLAPPWLSSASHRAAADYVLASLCLCVINFCHSFNVLQARYFKTNFLDLFKIDNSHSLHTTLEKINFWCRSNSRWLTTNGPKFAIFEWPAAFQLKFNKQLCGQSGRIAM